MNVAIRVMVITYQLGWSFGFSGNQTWQWVIKQFQVQIVPCHFSPSRWSFSKFCCNKPPPFLKKKRFRSGITQCWKLPSPGLDCFIRKMRPIVTSPCIKALEKRHTHTARSKEPQQVSWRAAIAGRGVAGFFTTFRNKKGSSSCKQPIEWVFKMITC